MRIFDGGDEVDSLESVKQEKDFFLITVFDNRGKAQFTLSRGDYLNLCRIGMQELRDDEINMLADREGHIPPRPRAGSVGAVVDAAKSLVNHDRLARGVMKLQGIANVDVNDLGSMEANRLAECVDALDAARKEGK